MSVEDLLATAVEPPRADESLTDQLDRLSNAFDAVQRYLEQVGTWFSWFSIIDIEKKAQCLEDSRRLSVYQSKA